MVLVTIGILATMVVANDQTAQNRAVRVTPAFSSESFYLSDGTLVSHAHQVVGTVETNKTVPVLITLSGAATFTNTDYYCTFGDESLVPETQEQALLRTQVIKIDGSHFKIASWGGRGQNRVTVFHCIGT
jgi:hypothetical protein